MTVYVRGKKTEDPPSAMIVSEVEVDPAILYRNDGNRRSYVLHLWYLDFDGDLVGRALSQKKIESFDGEKPIAELQVIPCDYIDRQDEQLSRDDKDYLTTRNRLVDLGKKWFGLLKGQMVFYNGEFPESPYTDAFSGRVFVDCDSYWAKISEDDGDDITSGPSLYHFSDDYQYTKSIVDCTCSACKDKMKEEKRGPFDSYWAIDPRETKSLELDESHWNSTLGIDEDHRYLICNHLLGGLVLKNRRWEKLNVACCSAIAPQAKAFENLVMNKSRKDLIKSLLYNYSQSNLHNAPKPWKADFIENKGDECIAEYTGRPLLSLICGDIGISEQDVDRNLQKWFTIGEKWGAVVLVDEADVYLESRQPGDVQRNGLVSVFLRAVEYYKGILFLTTNRVGQFDDAFISRIHVVLRYEKLRPNDRRQIWEGFFEKLEKERGNQIRISKSAKKYVLEDKEMTGIPWNGREIRNAFQTAVALAQYKFATSEDTEAGDKAVLDRDHFEEVCKMTTDFKKYLKKLHTKDEDARAAIARNRYDEDDSEDD
ncbi:hypothetical protein Daus18300_012598 [Diaporthe australafricana]|uniref:ATPase AAA-type core domain-containing protein n=1 Tax=Diaporthe australafricana TaxID=127596 RepID=A0ABR3W283_9PEZI